MIPLCTECKRPSGLYFSECGTCMIYADRYSYQDYEDYFTQEMRPDE